MAWHTLSEESDLLDAAVSTGRVAVDVIGTSVQGRPIRLVRLGTPPPPADRRTVFLTGGVHGVEPAGRQAILDFVDDMSTATLSGDQDDFLTDHGMMFVPTVNPDGFVAETRHNADDVDINRDFMALETPEARIVSAALATARPIVMWDLHEYQSDPEHTLVVQVNRAFTAQGHDDVREHSEDLRDQMLARATSESWDNDVWGATFRGDITLLDISAQLRHSIAGIVETNRFDDSDTNRLFRAEVQYAMIEEALDFAIDAPMSTLISDAEDAAADKTAEGAAGVEPFDLRSGGTLDPPPLAYDLTESQAAVLELHLDVWNVSMGSERRVLMGQQAQPVIPYLMDMDSPYGIVPGQRVFDLVTPTGGVTPQVLAPIVLGSHTPVFEARVMTRFQTGPAPTGEQIAIVDGSVTYDGTAEVFASLDLTTDGMDERRRSRFPRRASDLLAPYGHEMFVRRGVDIGSGILWSPLGYFRLDDDEQSPASDSPIRLTGQDRMSGIIDGEPVVPRQYGPDETVGNVVTNLVTDIYPAATIVFDNDSAEPLGRNVLVENDRYGALLDIAESMGKIVYWDGEGVLRIEDAPDPDEIVWDVKAGHHGVLVDMRRRVSREGMVNGIVARGEGGDTVNPVLGIAVDGGSNSPTRWFPPDDPFELWFGQVPGEYASTLLTTGERAFSAAAAQLRRRIGAPYSADFGSVVNPALRPRQAIRVVQLDGTREQHIVDTLTVPLRAQAHMTGTTREQSLVRISQVQPSRLGGV